MDIRHPPAAAQHAAAQHGAAPMEDTTIGTDKEGWTYKVWYGTNRQPEYKQGVLTGYTGQADEKVGIITIFKFICSFTWERLTCLFQKLIEWEASEESFGLGCMELMTC